MENLEQTLSLVLETRLRSVGSARDAQKTEDTARREEILGMQTEWDFSAPPSVLDHDLEPEDDSRAIITLDIVDARNRRDCVPPPFSLPFIQCGRQLRLYTCNLSLFARGRSFCHNTVDEWDRLLRQLQ